MKGCNKWLARVIAQQHNPILVKRRRTGVAPSDSIFADVDDAQVFAPAQLAVQIKAVKPFRTKEANEPFAIRAERRVMEAYELVQRLFFKQESANYRRSGGCCCDSTIAWYTIVRNSAISRTSVGSFCVIRMPMSCSFGSMKKLVEANPAQSYAPSEPMR